MKDTSKRFLTNLCCGLGIMAGMAAMGYLVFANALTLRDVGLSVRAQLIAQRVITPVKFGLLVAMAASAECLRRKIGDNWSLGRLLRWGRVALVVVIPFVVLCCTVKTPYWSFPSPSCWDRPRFIYGWPLPWKIDGAAYPLTFTFNLFLWTVYLMLVLGYRRFKSYFKAGVLLFVFSLLMLAWTGISPIGKHRSRNVAPQYDVQQESMNAERGKTAAEEGV